MFDPIHRTIFPAMDIRQRKKMATAQPVSPQDLETHLSHLTGWSVVKGKLHRELRFPNFVAAFGFMTKVALLAERMNHHPEWSNVYKTVIIDLSTHETGGTISQRDIELAQQINQLLE
jgi:4a-hydroxytetrahydrobiopterin dehydratase